MGDLVEKKEVEFPVGKLLLFMFGAFAVCFGIALFTANHQISLDCSDHATNGYTTRLGGDYLYPVCYVKLADTDKFIPLNKLYQIENYAKLA